MAFVRLHVGQNGKRIRGINVREKFILTVLWLIFLNALCGLFASIANQAEKERRWFEHNFNGGVIVKHDYKPPRTEYYEDCTYVNMGAMGASPTTVTIPICSTEERCIPAKFYVKVKGKNGAVERF